jgi:hypothetical protein
MSAHKLHNLAHATSVDPPVQAACSCRQPQATLEGCGSIGTHAAEQLRSQQGPQPRPIANFSAAHTAACSHGVLPRGGIWPGGHRALTS